MLRRHLKVISEIAATLGLTHGKLRGAHGGADPASLLVAYAAAAVSHLKKFTLYNLIKSLRMIYYDQLAGKKIRRSEGVSLESDLAPGEHSDTLRGDIVLRLEGAADPQKVDMQP